MGLSEGGLWGLPVQAELEGGGCKPPRACGRRYVENRLRRAS